MNEFSAVVMRAVLVKYLHEAIIDRICVCEKIAHGEDLSGIYVNIISYVSILAVITFF